MGSCSDSISFFPPHFPRIRQLTAVAIAPWQMRLQEVGGFLAGSANWFDSYCSCLQLYFLIACPGIVRDLHHTVRKETKVCKTAHIWISSAIRLLNAPITLGDLALLAR